ncbi:MAG TPA: hypothetical protein VN419_10935, partial [Humidesulfovibrio sp.]|nr:hypothetical protein [Humidesulfovibrio sp.]
PLDDMLPLVKEIAQGPEPEASGAPIYAVGIPSCPRACEPGELAGLLGSGSAPDVHLALERLKNAAGPVLVCGSLYLLGEFYTKHPRLLERPEREHGVGSPRRSQP